MGRLPGQDKRTLILEAALEVFSRRGVFATRIADIASEAGVAYGLIYHYFRNKEEILNTIFEDRWERVTDQLERAAVEGFDTRARLREAAATFLTAYRDRPKVVELLLLEYTRMSKFLEPVQLDRVGRAFAVVRRIFERGVRDGEIREGIDPQLLMLLFLGGIQMVIQAQMIGGFKAPKGFDHSGAEVVVDVFLEGVRAA